jgi:hypothetical protein
MVNLFGTYLGFVEDVNDPEKLGRVKVRVPLVYGPVNAGVSTGDIPWALPAGLPSGGTTASGGFNWLPNPGDQVYVRFLDGEPEKPLWEWGTQTRAQRDNLGYRRYNGRIPEQETLITRYAHVLAWDIEGITVTTRAGYALILQDADQTGSVPNGLWELRTSAGRTVTMDDGTDSLTTVVSQILNDFDDALFLGQTVTMSLTQSLDLNGGRVATLRAQRVRLGTDSASDPVVRRSDLQLALNIVMAWANSHTHPKVAPPVSPLTVTARGSQVTFSA